MSRFELSSDDRDEIIAQSDKHRTVENPHADATLVDSQEDVDFILACGYSHCPHCGIHLSNGLMDFDSLADQHGEKEAAKMQKHEWACMGCNGEWSTEIVAKGSRKRGAPTRHYIGKSTVEGAVALCHSIFNANPDLRRKDAIQKAVDAGVTFYTARTQYQKWFKAQKASRVK